MCSYDAHFETRSYTLNTHVVDQRGDEKCHHEINLIWLNPDKERCSDIEIRHEDEEALAAVANVIL